MLSHWGRTGSHVSSTAYLPDDYGLPYGVPFQERGTWLHPENPEDWRDSFNHECFDAERVRWCILNCCPLKFCGCMHTYLEAGCALARAGKGGGGGGGDSRG